MKQFLNNFGNSVVNVLTTLFCIAIFIWFIVTMVGNIVGVVTGKGLMPAQIKEKDKQIAELEEQLKAEQASKAGISNADIRELYNRLYTEYISINSYNDIIELQEDYSDLESDEYLDAVWEVYGEYEIEIKQMMQDVFGITKEEIEAALKDQ